MADLEDGGLLALQRDTNLNRTKILSPFDLPLFLISALFSRKIEKTVPFERTLELTHYFTNGKVSSTIPAKFLALSATSGENHSVVKLFTAVRSSRLASIKSRVAI